MSFLKFCQQLLTEGVNMGETMEGVFAIAVAAYMAFGKVDANTIRNIRSSIDLKNGKASYTMSSNVANNQMFSSITHGADDRISVKLEMNLRPKNVEGMFGGELDDNTRVDSLSEIVSQKIPNMSAMKRIREFMTDILTNNKSDDIEFIVAADGSDGYTTAKGEVKGDIKIKVHARTKTDVPKDIREPISFSLKTGDRAKTVSNLGIFGGLLKLGQVYGLEFISGLENLGKLPDNYSGLQKLVYDHPDKWNDEDHFIFYVKKYLQIQDSFQSKRSEDFEGGDEERKIQQSAAELGHLRELLKRFIQKFTSDIKGMSSDTFSSDPHDRVFASKTFQFLKKEIFGTDLADHIHITDKDIKEIRSTDFDSMKNDYVIKVDSQPSGIINFTGINISGEKRLLFRIIPRLEFNIKTKRKTQLLIVELGDLS